LTVNRREFLAKSGLLAGGLSAWRRLPDILQGSATRTDEPDSESVPGISFETSDSRYQTTYSRALRVLSQNITRVSGFAQPVLTEGSNYPGIWLECAPQEGLVYSAIRADIARNNHLAFLALQREDGQIPCWSRRTRIGFGQVQMAVPIAATAWELSQQTRDSELLEKSYNACGRWDAWLRRYRDTRHTGLCEGFCTWDTGQDNSPRWTGIPNRCPEGDARHCPPVPSLPRLCPDLSATVYGGRVALAEMARALGKVSESDRWLADAATMRSEILSRLYSSDDAAFYDLDAQDRFVRIRGDIISRVLGEHVPDQRLFETIYERQMRSPAAFWSPYPFPSVALDDPTFVRPIPRNCWGGAAQALTALRAPRWMEHYGKPADLTHLMQQWADAIVREGQFLQQMDPVSGVFTPDTGGYSPSALVFVDFTWRLGGVRSLGDHLEWNVRQPAHSVRSSHRLRLAPTRIAELRCASGVAELFLNEKLLCRTSSAVRLVTSQNGELQKAVGIAPRETAVILQHASGRVQTFSIEPNASVDLIPR
jgi:hypothetical protein